MSTPLDCEQTKLLIIAVLVKRLGGNITITQPEIDEVAYNILHEHGVPEGLNLVLSERKAAS